MKSFSALAALVLAVAGVSAQDTTAPATTAAPTAAPTTVPTTRPPCIDLNFSSAAQTTKINGLNTIIDLAIRTNLLADGLAQVDPLNVTNQVLDATNFSVLDNQFSLIPTIKTLKATGLSKIVPDHVNITGPTGLSVSAWINGTIDVSATISAEIKQQNKKWYQICWTNALDPIKCPSKTVDVNVNLSLNLPKILAAISLPMSGCSPGVKAAVCKDISVTELLAAATTQNFTAVGPRLLHRLKSVALTDFHLTFDKMNNISFQFAKADPLLQAIGEALYDFTEDEINKHRLSYNTFVSVVDDIVKKLIGQLLTQKVNPLCGSTCYDN